MIRHNKVFIIITTVFLCIWLLLFVNRVFELNSTVTIIRLTDKFEFITHFAKLYFLIKLYKKIRLNNERIAFWFLLISLGLFGNDVAWFFASHLHKGTLNLSPAYIAIDMIPSSLWSVAIIFFSLLVLKKYVIDNKAIFKVFFILIVLNIFIIVLFLSATNKDHLFSFVSFSQVVAFILRLINFDFIIICLANAKSRGVLVFLSGLIILISGDLFIDYSVISQTLPFYSYGDLFWLLGLILNLCGLILLVEDHDYQISQWFRRYNTIRSKLVFMHLTSAIVIYIIVRIAVIISEKEFLGLPLFIMFYAVAVIIFSTYLGNYFEEPFIKIENLIRSIITGKPLDKIVDNFSIDEFIFLQKFIIDAFKQKQTQEEDRIRLEREYAKADLDNLRIKEILLQEQINLEREKSKADILQLQIDNHKIAELEQERFHNVVQHVVHDIRSPLNTINNFITTLDDGIKEKDRVNLRLATRRLAGIAGNLLNKYKSTNNISYEVEDLLVASSLLQIISEKEVEYNDKNIVFNIEIDKSDYFAFIKINGDMFKRMISNLINNAVEALDEKRPGKITIKLRAATQNAVIFIEDNGVGMPEHVVDSFKKGIAITHNKDTGNGVGLVQVNNTIKLGHGECDIYATKGVGTEIVVQFPKTTPPQWLCSEIKIKATDEIIILDDDASVHGSWDKLLANLHHAYQDIKVTHFLSGEKALAHIKQIPLAEHTNTLLLSDYELLKQDLTGLDVIKQIKLSRVVLVTSYSSELSMQNQVLDAGIKMLPKELIAFVPVKLNFADIKATKKVDFVWLEDQGFFVEDISSRLLSGLSFDVYNNPDDFLNNIELYPKDTKILLDMFYETQDNKLYNTNGIFIAKSLFRMGYTKLYLLTGEEPSQTVPDYLKVILKNNDEAIKNLIWSN